MTISVPEDLRERMKPHDDKVNWSAAAAEKFEETVSMHDALGSITDEDERRFRASEAEDEAEEVQHGREAGLIWARRHARAGQLRRLDKQAAVTDDWSGVSLDSFARIVLGDPSVRWQDVPGAPEMTDEVSLEDGWLTGFVEGALAFLEEMDRRRT